MSGVLRNKVCLVTGTSKGIGKQTAELFAYEGGIVYASARSEGSLDVWAEEVSNNCIGIIKPIYFDVTDSISIKNSISRIKKEYGKLDVLVNNAGLVTNELLGMISINKMRQMFDVNVFGLMEISQMVATKLMRPNKNGSIINIASVVGVEGCKGQVAYSASKGAVISITKSMAKELAQENIRVNAVAPGVVNTERLRVTIKEKYKGEIPQIGMGRLAEPSEIADACLYFASDLSTYTTGQVLTVDGEMML